MQSVWRSLLHNVNTVHTKAADVDQLLHFIWVTTDVCGWEYITLHELKVYREIYSSLGPLCLYFYQSWYCIALKYIAEVLLQPNITCILTSRRKPLQTNRKTAPVYKLWDTFRLEATSNSSIHPITLHYGWYQYGLPTGYRKSDYLKSYLQIRSVNFQTLLEQHLTNALKYDFYTFTLSSWCGCSSYFETSILVWYSRRIVGLCVCFIKPRC